MHVTLVHVHVKPEFTEDFIEACRLNHEASIQEPGNRRFDILQSPEDPAYFLLYEAYRSAEDVAKHKETAHYRKWCGQVEPWMSEPRQRARFSSLFPCDTAS